MLVNLNQKSKMWHNTKLNSIYKLFLYPLFLASLIYPQSKDWTEFQVKRCSGTLTSRLGGSPIYAVKVSVLSGNKEIKDSSFTDLKGNFALEHVGYVWKPRIKFESPDYYNKTILLKQNHLNSDNEIELDIILDPIPDEEKPITFDKGTISERAKTFFHEGGVYYTLTSNDKPYNFKSERIIINTVETDQTDKNKLLLWINGSEVNPLLCYVPQSGRYENLMAILSGYSDDPQFEDSLLPKYLEDGLLEPTIVFGRVLDSKTNKPVPGVEVLIDNITKDMRVTGKDGRFAFQISIAGEIEVKLRPPGKKYKTPASSTLFVKNPKGGWIQTNQFLTPQNGSF